MAKVTKGRVVFPGHPTDFLALSKNVSTKHISDGAQSPLKTITDYNWDTLGGKIDEAIAKAAEAETLSRQAAEAFRERDLMLKEIDAATRNAATYLKSLHAKNPKRLGEWGFTVEDTVTNKPTPGTT
jgi:hypothetical protein